MRGLKLSGLLLVWMAVMSLSLPTPSHAQGATAAQYLAYGNQLYTAKNYAQALQYYSYAIKLDPNNAAAYQQAGYCYYATGNKQYALAYLQKSLQLNPNNAQLAQVVQSLGGAAPASTAPATTAPAAAAPAGQDAQYVAYGNQLYAAKDYAKALQYYGAAIKMNPNNANAYKMVGYCYFATGNKQYGLAYLQKYLQLNPNDPQIAQYVQSMGGQVPSNTSPSTTVAVATPVTAAKSETAFGFHLFGGTSYVFANPQQILDGATAAKSVSLTGVTPSMIALAGLEPYVQLGENFEINMNVSYLPIGNLSYTWNDFGAATADNNGGGGNGWSYVYNNSGIMAGLGVKMLFGNSGIKGYFGIGGDIAPISMTFTKTPIDVTGTPIVGSTVTASSGNYSTLAIGGHAKLGVDFYLGKSIAVGPFVGFQYLSATNFQGNGATLAVDPNNGDVDATDALHTKALTLDYTSLNGGVNLTFSF